MPQDFVSKISQQVRAIASLERSLDRVNKMPEHIASQVRGSLTKMIERYRADLVKIEQEAAESLDDDEDQ